MSKLSKAEAWNRVSKASSFINFTSFDFMSVKQSLIDYFKMYHPEFNNWIETDEFVIVIEAFAYVCEMLSYRIDMVGNENFLSTAQRKDSILKLAKFVSYKPTRVKPGVGLVKIKSIQTSENIYDVNGTNLANSKINWGDVNNINWKHQFLTIIDNTIVQTLGSVTPKNRTQIYDQVFELYTFNNIPLVHGVVKYDAQTPYKSVPMELVSCELNENGPYEQRPGLDNKFNFVYGTDGLGDSSNYTGFFILTKQGQLNLKKHEFDKTVVHNYVDILSNNINDLDVWVNQHILTETKNTNTGNTDVIDALVPWVPVDTINSQNVIFTDSIEFNRYEVETLANDNIRIHFGDGVYSEIPLGSFTNPIKSADRFLGGFDIWFRTSDPSADVIPANSINQLKTNLTYYDKFNKEQTLIIEFSSVADIQNASPSEDAEHIRNNAPAVYYSQNRMVTGHDYNNFLLQDNSILKLYSINRTFTGHSKFTQFNDASDTYQAINHFGEDLSIYVDTTEATLVIAGSVQPVAVIVNYIQPLLSDTGLLTYSGLVDLKTRRYFTDAEIRDIVFNFMGSVYLLSDSNPKNPSYPFAVYPGDNFKPKVVDTDNWLFYIDKRNDQYYIKYKTSRLTANSPSTRFYPGVLDKIVILKSNTGNCRFKNNNTMIPDSITMDVVVTTPMDDNHSVIVTMPDLNNDGLPDLHLLSSFIGNKITIDISQNELFADKKNNRLFDHVFDDLFDTYEIDLPTVVLEKTCWVKDIEIIGNVNNLITFKEQNQEITDKITITNHDVNDVVTIKIADYVYFSRIDQDNPFYADGSPLAMRQWVVENANNHHINVIRKPGRTGLNFLWQHSSQISNRINPSTSNIIDCFVITRNYYYSVIRWLNGQNQFKPKPPTTNELMASYSNLISHKMISDELILKSGSFKILFGKYADDELKAKFVIVRGKSATLTDMQIKSAIIDATDKFFDINIWNFGDTFNFTELSAYIHIQLQNNIESCVLVPVDFTNKFGTLYQINAMENEIFIPCVSVDDIEIKNELTRTSLNY